MYSDRSAYSSTLPSGKRKRFCTSEVSSRMRRPFSPSTIWVRVARMMISVRIWVTRTSTPAYPSSPSSFWRETKTEHGQDTQREDEHNAGCSCMLSRSAHAATVEWFQRSAPVPPLPGAAAVCLPVPYLQELVELCIEQTVCDELALLRDVSVGSHWDGFDNGEEKDSVQKKWRRTAKGKAKAKSERSFFASQRLNPFKQA